MYKYLCFNTLVGFDKSNRRDFYDIRQDSRFDNIQNDDIIMSIADTLHDRFKNPLYPFGKIETKHIIVIV